MKRTLGRISQTHWLLTGLVLVLFALSFVGSSRTDLESPDQVSGGFEPGSTDLISPTARPLPDRFWSSWAARDSPFGTFSFGPFPGPAAIEFEVAGYPNAEGNSIVLENTANDAVHPVTLPDPNEDWSMVRTTLPDSWRGDPVVLRVTDGSGEGPGWLAVSEPRGVPVRAAWWDGIVPRIAGVLAVGCALLFLLTAAALAMRNLKFVQGPGRMMAAAAAVMAVSYGVLWGFFFNHDAGALMPPAIFLGALVLCVIRRKELAALWRDPDWRLPALAALAIAVFVTGILYSFSVTRPTYLIAAQRWDDYGFPPDNILPSVLADKLREGQPLKPFWADWLSSDRPPLQAGWYLLVTPVANAMGAVFDEANQYAGIWFQMLWVPALWALVRTLKIPPRAAVLVVAAPALSGFFLIHSTYVWPKLGGGALMLAAFLNWFHPPPDREPGAGRFVLGGVQAGLAFLSHGSVVFALVPVGILALWRLRSQVRYWVAAATVMLLLIAPWVAYQKLSDPPGDRLLKMHLGGIADVDDRPLLEAIGESYAAVPRDVILQVRSMNLKIQFEGMWPELTRVSGGNSNKIRDHDFRYTFFALGWWNLGFGALAALAFPAVRKRLGFDDLRTIWHLLAWCGLTLVFWIAVMFAPGSTVIHQGSYTVQMVLFATLAAVLWRVHSMVFGAVVVAQALNFPRVWLNPPLSFLGEYPRFDAMLLCGLAAVAVLLLAWFAPPAPGSRISRI